MRFRSAFLLLILAAGLGAYAYYIERPAREESAETKRLFAFDADAVAGLTLTYPDQTIALTKSPDARWQLTTPIEVAADQTAANNLVRAIAEAELSKTIDDPPEDLAAFGFDEPTVTIAVQLADGADVPQLIVGDQTPIGFKAYVQKAGDPKLYLSTGAFHSGIKKELKDLRDKTIIDFNNDQIQAIRLMKAGKPPIVLQRDEDAWNIAEPGTYPADPVEVTNYLSSVRGLRAQDFIDDPEEDLHVYGLGEPRLRVVLSTGEDGTEKSVLIGGDAPGTPKRIYARRGERDTIYLLGDFAYRNLDKDLTALRDRTVLGFDPDTPREISIVHRDGESVTLVRAAEGPWSVQDAEGTPKESVIKRFVNDLRQTKPAEIASDAAGDFPRYGLDDPQLRISVAGEDGAPIGTLLATTHRTEGDGGNGDGEDKFFFAREGVPTVFEGREFMLTRLEKRGADFLEAPAESPDSADASDD